MTRAPGRDGWFRMLAAGAVGAALLSVAAGTDLVLGPRTAGPSDAAATTAGTGPVEEYLTDAALACPGGRAPRSWMALASAPTDLFGQEQPDGSGSTWLTVLPAADADEARGLDGPGQSSSTRAAPGRWGVVTGQGALAPGAVAAQLSHGSAAGARGLALTPCSTPADAVHLVGGGGAPGQVEQLVLTNPSDNPVTVDLEVLGEEGAVETVGGTGLVVPAREQLVQRLDAVAPGADAPAVRVLSTGGPVAAHLLERHRDGTTDLGMELVGAAAAPARDLVVPALPVLVDGEGGADAEGGTEDGADGEEVPDRDGSVMLRLVAPQEAAVVELRMLTDGGALLPDPAVVQVPAGSTVEVPLTGLPQEAVALRLRSDAPVTGGAVLRVEPSADEPVVPDPPATAPDDAAVTTAPDDAAVTTAPGTAEQAEPVRRPAGESAWVAAVALSDVPLGLALPELPALPTASAALAVSAVDATTAEVLVLEAGGQVRGEELELANDTTTVVELPDGATAVWVRPTGDAGVAAALHLTARDAVGPYLAAATLPPGPWTRQAPVVVPVRP